MSMERRQFLAGTAALTLSELAGFSESLPIREDKMPVLFVGHGNPMYVLGNNPYFEEWKRIGGLLPRPSAILMISAHWYTRGTGICAVDKPKMIYDFEGFPREMYTQKYPAPGHPALARELSAQLNDVPLELDHEWGLDHGAWCVLKPMFPNADIPVLQMSIDYRKPPQWHYDLGKRLVDLRKRGVLIIGSGNIVHNLGMFVMEDKAFDWAIEFDSKIADAINKGDHNRVIQYQDFGSVSRLAVPSNDHYLPLLYALSLWDKKEPVTYFNAKTTAGSISMRSVKIG